MMEHILKIKVILKSFCLHFPDLASFFFYLCHIDILYRFTEYSMPLLLDGVPHEGKREFKYLYVMFNDHYSHILMGKKGCFC